MNEWLITYLTGMFITLTLIIKSEEKLEILLIMCILWPLYWVYSIYNLEFIKMNKDKKQCRKEII